MKFLHHLKLLLLMALPAMALAAEPDAPNSIFLIAREGLTDPVFKESVVLITQHGRGGPVGVIINRPTQTPLSRHFPDNEALRDRKDPAYFGGPVSLASWVCLFRAQERPEHSLRVLPDVYMTASMDVLNELLRQPPPPHNIRLYRGFTNWAPGQLQAEIARGDWLVIQADAGSIFAEDAAGIWRNLSKRAAMQNTGGRGTFFRATPEI